MRPRQETADRREVADLGTLEETTAAHEVSGNAETLDRLAIHGEAGAHAREDRDLVERHARRRELRDPGRHPARRFAVLPGHRNGQRAGFGRVFVSRARFFGKAVIRFEAETPVGVGSRVHLGDGGGGVIHEPPQRRGGPEVPVEHFPEFGVVSEPSPHPCLGAPEDFHPGVAEPVDGLLVVTDDEERRSAQTSLRHPLHLVRREPLAAGPGLGDGLQQVPLRVARVLELVEEKVVVAGLEPEPALGELSRASQQARGREGEVVEVHHPLLFLERLVFGLHRLEQLPDGREGALVEEVQPARAEFPQDRLDALVLVPDAREDLPGAPGTLREVGTQPGLQEFAVEGVPRTTLGGKAESQFPLFGDRRSVAGEEPADPGFRGPEPGPQHRALRRRPQGEPPGLRLEPYAPGEPVFEIRPRDLVEAPEAPAEEREFRERPAVEAGHPVDHPLHRLPVDHRHLPFVEHFDARSNPGVEGELPDEAEIEGVERGNRHLGQIGVRFEFDGPEPGNDPLLHLRGRLAGERERQDVPGGNPRPDQIQVTLRKDRRLSGARRGAEHHVPGGIGGPAAIRVIARTEAGRGPRRRHTLGQRWCAHRARFGRNRGQVGPEGERPVEEPDLPGVPGQRELTGGEPVPHATDRFVE